MARMKDIADKAGVSVATVSKVINGIGSISPETKEKILTIAKEMNYVPNHYAQNLKKATSETIGVIVEDISVFNTPPIIDGIGDTCGQLGYKYLIENMRFDSRTMLQQNDEGYIIKAKAAITEMLSMQVDGIIYVGCHRHMIPASVFDFDVPFVVAYSHSPSVSIPSIIYDDHQGAYDATMALISKGCKHIGTITGNTDSIHTRNRFLGYQEALYDSSLPFNPHLSYTGDWTKFSGYEGAKLLLEKGADAIFAQNDFMALGVLDYCRDAELSPQKYPKLFGFDNTDICLYSTPALSSVALPLVEIGKRSTETLIKKIQKNPTADLGEVSLPCKIFER